MGKTVGQTITVWAQVFLGTTKTNATTLTFRFGLNFPPFFTPVNYTAVYAGSPGLYSATVTITANDLLVGVTQLASTAVRGSDVATTSKLVVTTSVLGPTPQNWTVSAGVSNYAWLGPRIEPGEHVEWRIDTRYRGNNTNASTLTAKLFISHKIDFSLAPVNLTPVQIGTGVYELSYDVPANWTEARRLTLQTTINEGNYDQSNATSDVWFYETIADFGERTTSRLRGALTIGDGDAIAGSLQANLSFKGGGGNTLGWINGTTNASGQIAFNITNDGSQVVAVEGWLNGSSAKQYVLEYVSVAASYTPPSVDGSRFDAIPLVNVSLVPWDGLQTLPFQFWDNGTSYANSWVHVIAWGSRGVFGSWNLTTDSSGVANVTVDFSLHSFTQEDAVNGGINLTLRAPVGNSASSSDGRWWGEDLEHLYPDAFLSLVKTLFDTDVTFASTDFALGSPLGVGAKYNGPKNTTGFEGGAILYPGPILDVFDMDRGTSRYGIWSPGDQPRIAYLVDGDSSEFFGTIDVPSYYPNTTYTLVSVIVDSLAVVGSEDGPIGQILYWTSISPGQKLTGFTPSADTTPPQIYGPADMDIDSGTTAGFRTNAYDNSLNFATAGNFSWIFIYDGSFVYLYGNDRIFTFDIPGNYSVDLTVTDGSGNSALHTFWVNVTDVTPPSIDAGPDFSALAGDTASFNATATDNDANFPLGAVFEWSFVYNGSLVPLGGSRVSFVFWALGNFDVTLNVTDAAGNLATDTLVVTVRKPDSTPPMVEAGADRSIIAGQSESFTGAATDNDPNFPRFSSSGWTFVYNGTAQNFSGDSFSFVFWVAGTYNLTYWAEDGWANRAQDYLLLTVVPPDITPPVVSAGADRTVVAGETAPFAGTATDDDPNFPAVGSSGWTFVYNGTTQNFSGDSFSFVFWAPGVYNLTYWAVDGWGNRAEDFVLLTVVPPDTTPPTANAGPDRAVLTGTAVTFDGVATTDNDPNFPAGATFTWSFTYSGSPVTLSGRSAAFTFSVAGTYTVTLTVTDFWGNTGTDTMVVTAFVPDTTPPVVQPLADATIAAGDTFHFMAMATDNSANFSTMGAYIWTFTYDGATVTLTGGQAEFIFWTAGNYTVTLVVRDGSGNAAPAVTFMVNVRPRDTTPPVVHAGADIAVEAGTTAHFNASATDAGADLTDDSLFTWTFTYDGATQTLNGRAPSFAFLTPGTYSVTLRVTDAAGNEASDTIVVTVTTPPPQTPQRGFLPGFEAAAAVAAAGALSVLVRRARRD